MITYKKPKIKRGTPEVKIMPYAQVLSMFLLLHSDPNQHFLRGWLRIRISTLMIQNVATNVFYLFIMTNKKGFLCIAKH